MNSITREPTPLWKAGVAVIPNPQRCTLREGHFTVTPDTVIALSGDTDDDDAFAATLLAGALKEEMGLELSIEKASSAATRAIRLVRGGPARKFGDEGYVLDVTTKAVTVRAPGAAGLYYGVQTLLQIIRSRGAGASLPALRIEDWPDYRYRAAHYDTKHHQDTFDYVVDFIEKLAAYKINLLIWEWEDKLAYKRRPEIGAPGAFTIRQMQELTAVARRHHVQLVPLIQGLGHVSFILKHRKHHPLREIPASNWEFCPLKDGTYEVLFDLWDDAMDATPGVEFLHIGTDETYELGQGEACGCKALAEKHGREYLMQKFIHRCHEHIRRRGRKMISWGGGYVPGSPHLPPEGLITFDYPHRKRSDAMAAVRKGYEKWVFTPNPLNCPLVVPMFPFDFAGRSRPGSAVETAEALSEGARLGGFTGMVACSWDDPGRHNEMWNIRHISAAEYAWTAHAPSVDEFLSKFFVSYFGPREQHLEELFRSMEDRMFFYYRVLQRRIWHYGPVGKMHLPDLPREDLEFDPFWRQRYADDVEDAKRELVALDRCADIIHDNLRRPLRSRDNLDILLTLVDLCRHNARLFTRMADLEENIGRASNQHWIDRKTALAGLKDAEKIVAEHIAERKQVMKTLIKVWEPTRLVKGMSTKRKKYVHARDRARHFANRTPDMSYLVHDEERLDMEGYLRALRRIIRDYEADLRKG
ncbi:MAG TPA: glycoside hydrolase family 20 zincin-like fold domain-containing protein [Planctomycetota bacterium]|nr:glycoside hydrolase family 20 zincin-like fold domain-containing protein [Planctomycetota bacterium]